MKTKIDSASLEKAAKYVTEHHQNPTFEEYWEYYNSIAPEVNRVSFEEFAKFIGYVLMLEKLKKQLEFLNATSGELLA